APRVPGSPRLRDPRPRAARAMEASRDRRRRDLHRARGPCFARPGGTVRARGPRLDDGTGEHPRNGARGDAQTTLPRRPTRLVRSLRPQHRGRSRGVRQSFDGSSVQVLPPVPVLSGRPAPGDSRLRTAVAAGADPRHYELLRPYARPTRVAALRLGTARGAAVAVRPRDARGEDGGVATAARWRNGARRHSRR